jgi:hypothetical protein
MTDQKNCPACVIRVVDPGGPGEWRDEVRLLWPFLQSVPARDVADGL